MVLYHPSKFGSNQTLTYELRFKTSKPNQIGTYIHIYTPLHTYIHTPCVIAKSPFMAKARGDKKGCEKQVFLFFHFRPKVISNF